jgi:sterol desaturase/sphingolipid hydroxylase (fatty acid hydroxylase superfamily)
MKIVVGFLILFIGFGILERLFPLRQQQKLLRQNWLTDGVHFFINHFLVNIGTYLVVVVLYILFHRTISPSVQATVRNQPWELQFIEAFLIAQLSFYTIHRMAHKIPWLWRFHAIHHSSAELDWLASARLHPVEGIITNIAIGVPLFWLGYTKESFGGYLAFSTLLAIFNHANTHLRFPIVRWIIATPEFHHWHHSNDPASRDRNFSGLPIIDMLFGTFYMPKNKMPDTYGVDEYIPNTYWQHLLYPFKRFQS